MRRHLIQVWCNSMIANKIYSILMLGVPNSGIYAKYRTSVCMSDNGRRVLDTFRSGFSDIPEELRALVISVVCHGVLYSTFGSELQRQDTNNTYTDAIYNADISVSKYLPSVDFLHEMLPRLVDSDIRDRIHIGSLFDYMGAICLQLTREVLI